MGISYILDIVIGLFFVYLILSLLASEIQELITTVLQWRAVHVKQSIEGLFSGNESKEFENAKELANKIYDNPLIKDLNQDAKGFWAKIPRFIGDSIGKSFKGVFGEGKSTGPASINKQIFASSFLDTLQIPIITKHWTIIRLKSFINDKLAGELQKIKNIHNFDKQDQEVLVEKWKKIHEFDKQKQQILDQYKNDKINFADALNNIAIEAYRFDHELFKIIFEDVYLDSATNLGLRDYRKKSLLRELIPSFSEIIQLITSFKNPKVVQIYTDIKKDNDNKEMTYKEFYKKVSEVVMSPDFKSKYFSKDTNKDTNKDTYLSAYIGECLLFYTTIIHNEPSIISNEEIKGLIENIPSIPKPLELSLYNLAKQSRIKAKQIEEQLNHFQGEVEGWFDRSMTRASGVYKRNAKLVAFTLGLFIAILTNADTFHMVDRLSKDQVLRTSLASSAEEIRSKGKEEFNKTGKVSPAIEADIKKIETKINNEISLPLGWSKQNASKERFSWNYVFSTEDQDQKETKYYFLLPKSLITVCGWIVSAIAISMGSSFWFDLLGKFIDIKNVGKKTPNSSDTSNSSNQN